MGLWACGPVGRWAGDAGEGAKESLQVLTEIKNRGINDVLMVVCDGPTGSVRCREHSLEGHDMQIASCT